MAKKAPRSKGKIIVITLVVLVILGTAITVPGIWYLVEPGYIVTSYIRIAPVVQNILTGEADTEIVGDYEQFVRTQTMIINNSGSELYQSVADDLIQGHFSYFEDEASGKVGRFLTKMGVKTGSQTLYDKLKKAINDGDISASAIRGTEFVAVSMRSMFPDDARVIVDSIVRSYLADRASGSTKSELDTRNALENRKKELHRSIDVNKGLIRNLAEQYGTTQLDSHQQMMAERTKRILAELSQLESSRIRLETQVQVLEMGVDPNRDSEIRLEGFTDFVNQDLLVQELTRRIVDLQVDIIAAKHENAPENPSIAEKQSLLTLFQRQLNDKRVELKSEYDQLTAERADRVRKEKLLATKAELGQLKAYEARLRAEVKDQDLQTVNVGNTNLDLKDTQFQIDLDTEEYDAVMMRLRQIDMESNRKPQITLESKADIQVFSDGRLKFTVITVLGSMGMLLVLAIVGALLRRRRPVTA